MSRVTRVHAASERDRRPLSERAAYRLGGAARSVVDALTWPFRALASPKRGRRKGKRRGGRRGTLPRGGLIAAQMAADQGLDALAKALGDPDPRVRTMALEVVTELSEDRAAGLLVGMLHDPSPQTRRAAAAAAARIGAQGVVFSLILALDDPDFSVCRAAKEAFEDLTNHPIELTFEEGEAERQRRIAELKEWWKAQRLSQLATGDEEGPR